MEDDDVIFLGKVIVIPEEGAAAAPTEEEGAAVAPMEEEGAAAAPMEEEEIVVLYEKYLPLESRMRFLVQGYKNSIF